MLPKERGCFASLMETLTWRSKCRLFAQEMDVHTHEVETLCFESVIPIVSGPAIEM